jgi:hypothetical protein
MAIAFASHGVGRRIVHPLLGTAPKGRVGSANLPNGRLTNSCNCRCLRRRRSFASSGVNFGVLAAMESFRVE